MSSISSVKLELSQLWELCLSRLKEKLPEQQFNTWIKPLQVLEKEEHLLLLAPNQFVQDWIHERYLTSIKQSLSELSQGMPPDVSVLVGTREDHFGAVVMSTYAEPVLHSTPSAKLAPSIKSNSEDAFRAKLIHTSHLNQSFTFETFVEGKSNQLARAAALQVAHNPGKAYNPMFIYGGVGLGKTHLVHAIGNLIYKLNPDFKVMYLHSERFVADMVKALKTNTISEFKRFYRSLNVLIIDDIQFFANKDRTQEEFFHTFNALLESEQQVILTSDRYPKEITGVEERLKSRFGWGLTVAVEPPELETRVAILMAKAEQSKVNLAYEVAFFIAKRIRSNVRELEGALKRVIANSHFTGSAITVDFVREALKDLLSLQERMITIENIQKTVADFYRLKINDLLSKKRSRNLARPRQMAMALAKELTNKSLPEIGAAFGGRDHTTVLHACKKTAELKETNNDFQEDYSILLRLLTS